jgi:uncharacterized protein (TIGR03067 family)
MRTRVHLLITIMSLVFSVWPLIAVHAQVQNDDAELKKFQGTWVLISGEMAGKKVIDEHVKQSKIMYSGDKLELVNPHQCKDTIYATVIKLDTTKNPKQMQWVRSSGPNAGITMTGIYEFEGPDMYRVCFDPAASTVPNAFNTNERSGHIWQTWKRVKE